MTISKNSNKIPLDKYYTPPEQAKYVVKKTKEVIGDKNITEYIEPSAGAGVFLDYLNKPYLAYDIEPEDDRIIRQDYLDLAVGYKKGRCVIGNPPFGRSMNLARQFYNKSVELGDYISFILPIKQLNNDYTLYKFDLIYSEDLGLQTYTDRDLHCCFNIYKRPNNNLNRKPQMKLKDVEIISSDPRQKINFKDIDADLEIIGWGAGVGKSVSNNDEYCDTYKIVIKNDSLKNEIINCIKNIDWHKEVRFITTPRINKYHIIKVLKKYIAELE